MEFRLYAGLGEVLSCNAFIGVGVEDAEAYMRHCVDGTQSAEQGRE